MSTPRRGAARILAIIAALGTSASTSPLRAGEPAWLPTFERLLVEHDQARTALDFLHRLPLAQKRSRDFHAALARAARAVGSALWASRAVMIADNLLPGEPTHDLSPIRAWLSEQGLQRSRQALDAYLRGDRRQAARLYLSAVRCDQAVLRRGHHELRDLSYRVIDRLARRHSENPEYWGYLAFYSYFYGYLEATRPALLRALELQEDPYMHWVLELCLERVEEELRQRQAGAPPATPPPTPDAIARRHADQRRRQVEFTLQRVDSRIRRIAREREGARDCEGDTASEVCRVFERLGEELEAFHKLRAELSEGLETLLLEAAAVDLQPATN